MLKKTISLCLGLALLAAAGLPARAQDAAGVLKLTLNECIERALQNNISLQVAVLGPESAALSLQKSKEKYLPTLSHQLPEAQQSERAYSFLDVAGATNITKTDSYGGSVRQSKPLGRHPDPVDEQRADRHQPEGQHHQPRTAPASSSACPSPCCATSGPRWPTGTS